MGLYSCATSRLKGFFVKEILFSSSYDIYKDFYPEPSSKNIPDWYKHIKPYTTGSSFKVESGSPNPTIKKCIPVFDAITMGYMLKTYVDIYVSLDEEGNHFYYWPNYDPISFHPINQAPNHPQANSKPYPKLINPWSIKTSKGYSCLFIPPMHNPNNIFTIMPGVVDTDKFIETINFPFTMNDPNFEGIIPAGTNICQVIPFKRDSFKMKIGNKKDVDNYKKFSSLYFIKFVNNYKTRIWQKKHYK